ncbi:MAG: hypothetical protein QOH68_1584 [Nocardioidaceae bacterium]|nr:hypothetical protein [Nocardioidaceae bacterium]
MSRVRLAVHEALWGPETGRRLLVVHSGLAVLIALRVALGPYRRLAGQPKALFDPVPILGWLDHMPGTAVIAALQVVGTLAAIAAASRRWPRQSFAVAWLCYLVLVGLRGSRGKVLHNDLLLLWTSAAFLLAPAAVTWSDRARRRVNGWPIRLATIVTALIYFFAGYHKLRRSGIDWVLGDNMRYVMLWGPSVGQAKGQAIAEWIGQHLVVAKATAAGILGVELTFPFAIFVPKVRPLFAVAAVALHTMTFVLLGLDYWAWAAAVPLILVDWPAVVDRVHARRSAVT